MELSDLQDAIVDDLRPAVQRLAARQPQFVASVLKRLVERTPDRYPVAFWQNESDREDFVARVAVDLGEQPIGTLGPFWLVVLFQVLLPALIRVFLLWWADSEWHRSALRALRDRMAQEPATITPAERRSSLWRMLWPWREA